MGRTAGRIPEVDLLGFPNFLSGLMLERTGQAALEMRPQTGKLQAGRKFPLSTGEGQRFMAGCLVSLKIMRLPRWFFWLLLYAGGPFGWMVFFEHGAGWERFQAGVKVEFARAWAGAQWWVYGKAGF